MRTLQKSIDFIESTQLQEARKGRIVMTIKLLIASFFIHPDSPHSSLIYSLSHKLSCTVG